MMKRRRYLPILVIAATLAVSFAGVVRAAPYEQCIAAAGGVDPQIKACDVAELKVRDEALNKLYQQVMGAVGSRRQGQFRAAERAWVAFRDAECDFQMSAEAGGADAPIIYNACQLELTADRIQSMLKALKIAKF